MTATSALWPSSATVITWAPAASAVLTAAVTASASSDRPATGDRNRWSTPSPVSICMAPRLRSAGDGHLTVGAVDTLFGEAEVVVAGPLRIAVGTDLHRSGRALVVDVAALGDRLGTGGEVTAHAAAGAELGDRLAHPCRVVWARLLRCESDERGAVEGVGGERAGQIVGPLGDRSQALDVGAELRRQVGHLGRRVGN